MKRNFTILLLLAILSFPNLSSAQHNETEEYNNKGEFHIGLNDFASLEDGGHSLRITPRFGYSFTDRDMIFIDFTFVDFLYPGHEGYEGYKLESSLNYRRYFTGGQFRPFAQAGVGLGYSQSQNILHKTDSDYQYYKFEIGAGVSYRYKKWSFEAGMKANYNEYGTHRFQTKPMVGVSFSF